MTRINNAKRQKKYQKRKKAEEGGIFVDKRGSTCKIALCTHFRTIEKKYRKDAKE